MGEERLLLHNVSVVSAVLKVGVVERRRLGCLKVLGDSESRRSGWSCCFRAGYMYSWMVRNLETVEEVNAYVAEAE